MRLLRIVAITVTLRIQLHATRHRLRHLIRDTIHPAALWLGFALGLRHSQTGEQLLEKLNHVFFNQSQ